MVSANHYAMNTIPYLLYKRYKTSPNQIAYSFPEFHQEYSWTSIWKEVISLSKGFLKLDIKKGDHIVLLMPNRIELILSIFACACVGAIAVPLNRYSTKHELEFFLEDTNPSLVIIGTQCHNQHYPTMFKEILRESNSEMYQFSGKIFVVNEDDQVNNQFQSFSELFTLGSTLDDNAFTYACGNIGADDPFTLLYTSGTTAQPKGILRTTQSFLVLNTSKNKDQQKTTLMMKIADTIAGHFSLMSLLPLYHLGGLSSMFTNLKDCNIKIVMLSYYHPINALKILEQQECKFLVGTPFMIQRMILSTEMNQIHLPSLIGLIFTSSVVHPSTVQQISKYINLSFFIVSYGSSEAGSVSNGICLINKKNTILSIFLRVLSHTNLLGGLVRYEDFLNCSSSFAGKVGKSVDVRIVNPETRDEVPTMETGEILIKGHHVMKYNKVEMNNSRFTEDGWYKSGDLGYMDNNRLLFIEGRLTSTISRGGEKISPIEIENALLTHEHVVEAYVYGVPDESYGEEIAASIILEKESSLTSQELIHYLRSYLSSFKIPKYIAISEDVLLSGSGKVPISRLQSIIMDEEVLVENA